MDEVHTYRDQYGTDVCVLIISNADNAGEAYLNASVSTAFSVVLYDYATGYYTFAHEIGHNLNCLHDKCENPGGTYNHGYEYCSGNWRTIMAYNQSCCTNAVTSWPCSPLLSHLGKHSSSSIFICRLFQQFRSHQLQHSPHLFLFDGGKIIQKHIQWEAAFETIKDCFYRKLLYL